MATAKLKDNQVKVRFPTAQECIDYQNCYSILIDCLSIYFRDEDGSDILTLPTSLIGKEVILTKNPQLGVSYTNKGKEYLEIMGSELPYFHELIKVIEGKLAEEPLKIDEYELLFDNSEKIFRVGCKRIDMKLADRIFHFLGEHLGYEIT